MFVDVGKVGVQPTAGQKLRVQGFAFLLDILQEPPPPDADMPFFLSRYCQTGDFKSQFVGMNVVS